MTSCFFLLWPIGMMNSIHGFFNVSSFCIPRLYPTGYECIILLIFCWINLLIFYYFFSHTFTREISAFLKNRILCQVLLALEKASGKISSFCLFCNSLNTIIIIFWRCAKPLSGPCTFSGESWMLFSTLSILSELVLLICIHVANILMTFFLFSNL